MHSGSLLTVIHDGFTLCILL